MSERSRMTRRDFLRVSALGAAGVLAASCAPQVVEKTVEVEKVVKETVVVEKEVAPAAAPVSFSWLSVLHWFVKDFDEVLFPKLVQGFNDEHPEADITIDRVDIKTGWSETIMTEARAGTVADTVGVLTWHIPWLESLAPLDPLDEHKAKVGGDDAFTYNIPWKGHYYHLDYYGGPLTPWYNKDWMDEVGVEFPKTWDEYIPIALEVADPANEKYASTIKLGGEHIFHHEFVPWLLQAGGEMIDESNMLVINNPGGVMALEFMKEQEEAGFVLPGSLSNTQEQEWDAFIGGTGAWQTANGVWTPGELAAFEIDFEWAATVNPKGPDGDQMGLGIGTGLCAKATAEHLEYVKDFVIFMCCGEGNWLWHSFVPYMSTYKPMLERTMPLYPFYAPVFEQAKIGVLGMPCFTGWEEMVTTAHTNVHAFWQGEKSAKQALDDWMDDWRKAIERV